MNCIDCEWVINCSNANENKKHCTEFFNAHRKVKKMENRNECYKCSFKDKCDKKVQYNSFYCKTHRKKEK